MYPCLKCGMTYEAATGNDSMWDFQAPLGHSFTYITYDEYPTCTKEGLMRINCATYGCDLCYYETAPATGHTWHYEKSYIDLDGDGRDDTSRTSIICENCDEVRLPSIIGWVRQEGNHYEITGATVAFTDGAGNVTTANTMDYYGFFAELSPGNYTMKVSAKSYKTRVYNVKITEGQLLEMDAYLNTTGYADSGVIDLKDAVVTVAEGSYHETGEPITPPVTVTYDGETLTEGVDYTLEYTSNTSWGHGYAKVKGIGVYTGEKSASFYILPKTPDDPGESPQVQGDVSGDGVLDGRDLLRLAKYLAGTDVEINIASADFNGDGNVDGRDLLRMAKYLAGQ